MADTTTTSQIVREAPEIEAYKTGVYQSGLEYVKNYRRLEFYPQVEVLLDLPAKHKRLATCFGRVLAVMNLI